MFVISSAICPMTSSELGEALKLARNANSDGLIKCLQPAQDSFSIHPKHL
jgi:hypothetical protein